MNEYKTIEELSQAIQFRSIEAHKKGLKAMGDDDVFDLFTRDDERCQFRIGDRVQKATFEHGDIHQIGHKGIITGNYFLEDSKQEKWQQVYLVQFEGDEAVCFTLKYKLNLL